MPDPVTGIMAASAIGGGISNIMGAQKGAGDIANAQNQANQLIQGRWQQMIDQFQQIYGQGKTALQPFLDTGTQATQQLSSQLPDLTAPITMDQATLEQTPGYQFTKAQGLRGVTQGNVMRGLSGAQLKGAADFVTGLADNTYQTQFNIANTNKTNAFNRLFQTAGMGQQIGTNELNTGVQGVSSLNNAGVALTTNQSGNIMTAGQAQAGADIATGQQIGSMISGAPYTPYIANKLYPNGISGATGMYGSDVYGSGAASGGNNGGVVWGR